MTDRKIPEPDPELMNNPPKDFESLVKGEARIYRTEHGIWATDGYRFHWMCPLEELPPEYQKIMEPERSLGVGYWKPSQRLIKWLRLVARHAEKPAYVSMEEDHWRYESNDKIVATTIAEKPPFGAVDYNFNAEFLSEALEFILCGKKNIAVEVAPTKWKSSRDIPAWYMTAGWGRAAVLAPAKPRTPWL